MGPDQFKNSDIILASKSPRRQSLLKHAGIPFRVVSKEIEESFPSGLEKEGIALYLAELKASHFNDQLANPGTIVITADTVVWHLDASLGKPSGPEEAMDMLHSLSGRKHEVITGVCLLSSRKKRSFFASTVVSFKHLSNQEVSYYVDRYKPFDKAGGYGIQEWIGHIGITSIEGSYFNVMGLPVQKLYDELIDFINS